MSRPAEVARAVSIASDSTLRRTDSVVVEEPLAIEVGDQRLLVTMRTPGHDRELVLGLLFAEGLIRSLEDVASLSVEEDGSELASRARVVLRAEVPSPPLERRFLSTAACGVCGRPSLEDLWQRIPTIDAVDLDTVALDRAFEALRETQSAFAETGGCHAAGLVRRAQLLVSREDVGRHNAVDKAVGAALERSLPRDGLVLLTTGRASFEIVQKAAVLGCGAVAAIGAPTSLAVEVAQLAGMRLYAFAGKGRATSYTAAGDAAASATDGDAHLSGK